MSEAKECYLGISTLADATTDRVDRVILLTGLAEISADYGRRDEALRFLTRARGIDLPEFPRQNEMTGLVTAAYAKLRLFDRLSRLQVTSRESGRAWEFANLASDDGCGLKDRARSSLSRACDAISSSKNADSVLEHLSCLCQLANLIRQSNWRQK
jgi:hypothetical protein